MKISPFKNDGGSRPVIKKIDRKENLWEDKGPEGRLIAEFSFRPITGRESPLAKLLEVHAEDLRDYVEIMRADPYVPSLSYPDVMKRELTEQDYLFVDALCAAKRRIIVA